MRYFYLRLSAATQLFSLLLLSCLLTLPALGQRPARGAKFVDGSGGTSGFTLAGPSQNRVCTNANAVFTATANGSSFCPDFDWTIQTATPGSPDFLSGATIAYSWPQAGTYQVAVTSTCDGQPITKRVTITVVDAIAGDITPDGVFAHATLNSAAICQNAYLGLTPPANSSNWAWTGPALPRRVDGSVATNTVGRVLVNPPKTATYTVTYNLPNIPCSLSSSFTVRVLPATTPTEVLNTERFGPGPLAMTVKEYNADYSYAWYEYDVATGVTSANPVSTTKDLSVTLTQSQAYQLKVTSCAEFSRTVFAIVKQVALKVNGSIPTAPVPLPSTTNAPRLLLQADTSPNYTGNFTWTLDGIVIPTATGATLSVTQPGQYVVTIPGTGPEYISNAVDVMGVFDGQTLNDQPLTYINDITVLQAGVMTSDAVAALPAEARRQTLTYTNGLGQPVQQIAVQAGPQQQDVVQHFTYAGDATTAQKFMAYPLDRAGQNFGRFVPTAESQLNTYYQQDGLPYSTLTGEASPLGRPLSQTQPGTAWAGHAATTEYQGNAANEVRYWVNGDGSSWYGAGQLSKEIRLDPDKRRLEVFTDAQGRVILQRKISTSAQYGALDTYSVYDEQGRLQTTIPPAAVEEMTARNNWNLASLGTSFASRWLYQYTYDERGRMVERKFPGAAAVWLVYDAFDRPILVQDGNHRAAGEWLFTKFDVQNRAAVEGIWRDGRSRQALQSAADNFSATVDFETRNSQGYTTAQTFPAITSAQLNSSAWVLSMTFYGDYDLNFDGQADYAYQPATFGNATAPDATTQLRGLVTATRRRIVLPNRQYGGWLTTALFYDQYGNVIQKQSDNQLQNNPGLRDITSLLYKEQGFVPQVLQSEKKQQTDRFDPVTVRNRYQYDAAGRPLKTWQQHLFRRQWEPEVLLSSNKYSGLGELTQKQLHSRDGGARFLQTEDFAYNMHGQLTRINRSDLTVNPENDLFGLELGREKALNGLGNIPRFDGGVSAVTWGAHNADQHNQPERERSYSLNYDDLGRLLNATYVARTGAGGTWSMEAGAYNESKLAYDANGNLTHVQRNTQAGNSPGGVSAPVQVIDDLNLTYDLNGELSNRLQQVDDRTGNARGFSGAAGYAYAYDENGSIITDKNKGLSYSYNTLNKVEQQATQKGSITYTYSAAGTVLQREVNISGGAGAKTEYYVDGLLYEQSATLVGLRSVPTPEGRAMAADANATRLTYEYHLRDHLGNLRVAFRAQPGKEDLRLSSENPSQEEGDYPKFQNVAATQSQGAPAGAYHGAYEAAVTNAQPGPAIAIPVSHLDHLKVRVHYHTPAGVQTYFAPPSTPPSQAAQVAQISLAMLPMLTPTTPAATPERPARPVVGAQVSLTGLLSRLVSRPAAADRTAAQVVAKGTPKEAYLQLTLRGASGQILGRRSLKYVAPVTFASTVGWDQLEFTFDADLSSEDARTGTLQLEELNDGSQAVYFDSLTITHPLDRALVSQENHYYPFGLPLSGVAVNTVPVAEVSKQQFNEGSDLQDELLGTEGGIYSTFYRNYDPATGRFTGVDPLADATPDWTPYQFGLANPLAANDPTGALSQAQFQDILDRLWAEADFGGFAGWSSGSGFTGPGVVESNGQGGFQVVFTYEAQLSTGKYDSNYNPITRGSGEFWRVVQPIQSAISSIANNFKDAVNYFDSKSGDISNTAGAVSFLAGSAENQISNLLASRSLYGVPTPAETTILRAPLVNIHVPTSTIRAASTSLKVLGAVTGAIGVGVTAYQYANNQISGTEAIVDTVLGVVGFFGMPGAIISASYFGGKYLYEKYSGNTLFEKPTPPKK